MTPGQLLTVWFLLALAAVGIPAAALGAWIGRALLSRAMTADLRAALDTRPRLAPLPPRELPRAGSLPYDWQAWAHEPRPFPADTGPLLLLSESAAALDAHEIEVRALIIAAEQQIGRLR